MTLPVIKYNSCNHSMFCVVMTLQVINYYKDRVVELAAEKPQPQVSAQIRDALSKLEEKLKN
jgi:hypothetical protein